MVTIYLKEIRGFFSTLQGYVITGVFLLTTALFLWVIPGNWNIPESGYANLNGLFELAPWLFLFLVPAVTMRLFAEEFRTGTIELILTRPLHTRYVIFGKFMAAVTLILIALVPTLVWFWAVGKMAMPSGNVDSGAIWGSYIALLLLGCVYASIGIFASSLTNNQVVAFILTLVLCFLFYSGFSLLGAVPGINAITGYMETLSIEYHYQSVSRGVLDSRDIIYFISVMTGFLGATIVSLKQRMQ